MVVSAYKHKKKGFQMKKRLEIEFGASAFAQLRIKVFGDGQTARRVDPAVDRTKMSISCRLFDGSNTDLRRSRQRMLA